MSSEASKDRPGPATKTGPSARDARLLGRTYAIPFAKVWTASVELADGGLRGWSLTRADDRAGVLEAVRHTLFRKQRDLIVVDVGLDENGQTRVDLTCRRENGSGTARRHASVIDRFCRSLDKRIGARAADILGSGSLPTWSAEEPT